jgi:hypothetical protein
MKIKRATAELTEIAGGLISQIGSSGDTLNRLQEMVRTEQERAAGRARVARDSMNMPDLAMKEAEQKALAEQALAQFAAEAGITLQAAPPSASPQSQPGSKEALGPAQIKT